MDEEIAYIGRKRGIEVPFLHPPHLATDTATSEDAIRHVLEWLCDNNRYENKYAVLLEPTASARRAFHIQEVTELIQRGDMDSLMGVTKLPAHFHPLKVVQRDERGMLLRSTSQPIRLSQVRGQEFPQMHFTNGAIYAFKICNLFAAPLVCGETLSSVTRWIKKQAFDTNTAGNLVLAELNMKYLLDQ